MMDMDEEDLVDSTMDNTLDDTMDDTMDVTMDDTMDDTMDETLDQHIHLETEKLLEGKIARPEVTQQPGPEVVAPGRTRGRPCNVVAPAPTGLGKRVSRQR